MPRVLIVDDSPVDQRLAGKMLERRMIDGEVERTDITVSYAGNGLEALEAMAKELPDAVVTDLHMPEMDGLGLVLHIRAKHPLVPVILMTAHGSEELAVRALQGGAASYVPKRELPQNLLDTVETVIEAAKGKKNQQRLMECLTQTESHFVLGNDTSLIPPLVAHLKDNTFRMSGSDETGLIQVTMALHEAILNAVEHGNLELDSSLKEAYDDSFQNMAKQRRTEKPYCDRKVHVISRETAKETVYIIRDEGPGFDINKLPDPNDPANLEKSSGRGLLLIRAFMSEVRHNATGNEITMIRRPTVPAE